MKDKIIQAIREVSIVDKTYEEYVEALADRLQTVIEDTRDNTILEVFEHLLKKLPVKAYKEANNEQRKAD